LNFDLFCHRAGWNLKKIEGQKNSEHMVRVEIIRDGFHVYLFCGIAALSSEKSVPDEEIFTVPFS
jgi:hypothetical protein